TTQLGASLSTTAANEIARLTATPDGDVPEYDRTNACLPRRGCAGCSGRRRCLAWPRSHLQPLLERGRGRVHTISDLPPQRPRTSQRPDRGGPVQEPRASAARDSLEASPGRGTV